MNRATKLVKFWKTLKSGDTVYFVNPLSCGASAQKSVENIEIKIEEIKHSFFLGLFGKDVLTYKDNPRIDFKHNLYLDDVIRHPSMLLTTSKEDADKYLETVHNGEQARFVDTHHHSVAHKHNLPYEPQI
jgi:hypothetical protein